MISRSPIADERTPALHKASTLWINVVHSVLQFVDSEAAVEAEIEAAFDDSLISYLGVVEEYEMAVSNYWAKQPDAVVAMRTRSLPRRQPDRALFLDRVHCNGKYREGDELNIRLLRARFELLTKILHSIWDFEDDAHARSGFAAIVRNLGTPLCPKPVER